MRRTNLDEAMDIITQASEKAIQLSEESIMDCDGFDEENKEKFLDQIQSEISWWKDIKENLRSRVSLFMNESELPEDPQIEILKKQIEELKAENSNLQLELKNSEEKVKNLSIKNMSLQAKIQYRDEALSSKSGTKVLNYNLNDWYPGECNDFLLSILSQIKNRLVPGSRAEEITNSLLESNQPVNEGDEILDMLKNIYTENSCQISDSYKKSLEKYGFEFPEKNGHQKIIPFNDPSRLLVVASSPSDKRGANNAIARAKNLFASKVKV